MLADVASTPNGFDWDDFRRIIRGYPFSKLDWLASRAGVDEDWFYAWIRHEVAQRRAELPSETISEGSTGGSTV